MKQDQRDRMCLFLCGEAMVAFRNHLLNKEGRHKPPFFYDTPPPESGVGDHTLRPCGLGRFVARGIHGGDGITIEGRSCKRT